MGLHNRGAAEGRLDGATTYRADVFSWTNDVAAPSGQVAGSIVCNGNLHHSVKQLKGFACNSLGVLSCPQPTTQSERADVRSTSLPRHHCNSHTPEQIPRPSCDVYPAFWREHR